MSHHPEHKDKPEDPDPCKPPKSPVKTADPKDKPPPTEPPGS